MGKPQDRRRVAKFQVEYADKNRTKYYMVYVTHNSRGLVTFAEVSEKCVAEQEGIKRFALQAKREIRSGTQDMFLSQDTVDGSQKAAATAPWLNMLPQSGDSILVNLEAWAFLLEQSGYLPGELQKGLGVLIVDKILEVDGYTSRRRVRHVRWEDGELVRRLK